jgi:addiction module RelE/StbE family toxin
MLNNRKLLIEFSPLFEKRLHQLPSEIVIALKETIDLLVDHPHHERLRRHSLKQEYSGYESIDITDDYRAIFKEIKTGMQVVIKFRLIGTHPQLYGKK